MNQPSRKFNSYPSEPHRRNAWIARVRRVDYTPSASVCVCSYDFRDEDYSKPADDTPAQFRKATLKKTAVQSLNLRGGELDERLPKRTRNTASQARAPLVHEEASVNAATSFTFNETGVGAIEVDTLKRLMMFPI